MNSNSHDVDLSAALESLAEWARRDALPLWAEAGFDREAGRFEERLGFDAGRLPTAPIRLMVQARQMFVYGLAGTMGWFDGGLSLVETAGRSLMRDFRGRDGRPGLIHSIRRNGAVYDATRDAYAHAFALFGCAAWYAARRAPEALALADDVVAYLDDYLAASGGGYLDGDPRPDGLRRQNPHMHLLEAFLALHEASHDERHLRRALGVFDLFRRIFFDEATGSLIEYFDNDWRQTQGVKGRIREPGHHYEWAWLLRRLERATGTSTRPYSDALIDHADRYGWDAQGMVVDEVLENGAVHGAGRRVWPVTEAIKAYASAQQPLVGENGRRLSSAMRILKNGFLSSETPGGWVDRFTSTGARGVDFMPASAFYHIFCAISEADRALRAKG